MKCMRTSSLLYMIALGLDIFTSCIGKLMLWINSLNLRWNKKTNYVNISKHYDMIEVVTMSSRFDSLFRSMRLYPSWIQVKLYNKKEMELAFLCLLVFFSNFLSLLPFFFFLLSPYPYLPLPPLSLLANSCRWLPHLISPLYHSPFFSSLCHSFSHLTIFLFSFIFPFTSTTTPTAVTISLILDCIQEMW